MDKLPPELLLEVRFGIRGTDDDDAKSALFFEGDLGDLGADESDLADVVEPVE